MKLQRYSVHDVDVMDFILTHGAIWCKDDDVEVLESENAALHAENDRLLAMLGPQKPMSAEDVTEPGFYHTRNYEDDWTIVHVTRRLGGGFRERQFYCASDCELSGQYIGPIKMPEVSDA